MHAILEWLLDALAPRRCLACAEPSPKPWCPACGEPELLTDPASVGHTPLFAAGSYEGPLAAAIRRFKYDRHPELAVPLGGLLVPAALSLAPFHRTALVPVPLHFERLVERGFNQSALLARALSRKTGARCLPRMLARRHRTAHQAGLDRDERRENIRGAFEARGKLSDSVILVDDVVTTGATARACIDALQQRGVGVRAVLALAHTAQKR